MSRRSSTSSASCSSTASSSSGQKFYGAINARKKASKEKRKQCAPRGPKPQCALLAQIERGASRPAHPEIDESRTRIALNSKDLQTLPNAVANLTWLVELYLDGNKLQTLPAPIGELKALRKLGVTNNKLRSIAAVAGCSELREFRVFNNLLHEIPVAVCTGLHHLKELYIGGNRLEALPEELGQLSALSVLNLDGNSISKLPESIGSLEHLRVLWLQRNALEELPESFGSLAALEDLNMHSNRLKKLRLGFGNLTNLAILDLGHNRLESLPPSIWRLGRLTKLFVGNNRLEKLPRTLPRITTLEKLSVQNNALTELPQDIGELSRLVILRVENNQLRELPVSLGQIQTLVELSLGGNTSIQWPPRQFQMDLAGLMACLRGAGGYSLANPPSPSWEIEFGELELGETIGRGEFGCVMLAKWNGQQVAVKRLKSQNDTSLELSETFCREVSMLSTLGKIKYEYVVRYIGACVRPPNLCIITEYVPRGTLYQVLRQKGIHWSEGLRLRLASQIACGLRQLHSHTPNPIIHYDFNSKNILITDEWTIKIADFGLSHIKGKLCNEADEYLANCASIYSAPEVLQGQPYSEKADVYSLGIVLWEIYSRCDPFEGVHPSEIHEFVTGGGRLVVPKSMRKWCEKLVRRTWHEDPEQRCKARDVQEVLCQRLLKEGPVEGPEWPN